MKTLSQTLGSAALSAIVLFGALGLLGYWSNQSTDKPDDQSMQSVAVSDVPSEEDWVWLDNAYQRALTYDDLSLYTDETAELMERSRDMAARVMRCGSSRSQVRGAAQQLESVMLIMKLR